MYSIAPATQDDIPQLCILLTILFTQETDFKPNANKQSAGLRKIIEHPEIGRILILHESNNIIGMVNLLFTVSTACGGKVALLEDMIIHPFWRGMGLGRKLLGAAIEQARQDSCMRITLLTDSTNDIAISFYQGHGFGISGMMPLRLTLN